MSTLVGASSARRGGGVARIPTALVTLAFCLAAACGQDSTPPGAITEDTGDDPIDTFSDDVDEDDVEDVTAIPDDVVDADTPQHSRRTDEVILPVRRETQLAG